MPAVFLTLFALIWSGMVLSFDGFMGRNIYRQFVSRQYPSVTGTITHSEVKSHRTSKGGTTYNAVIEYAYAVGDRKFTGDRIRFGLSSSGFAAASQLVGDHPVASDVPVFYNSANPQESLLITGVKGADFMGLLFLTPFNMIMLGFWIWIGGWLREHWLKPVAGGVKIISDGGLTRVRLPQFPALGWGLAATGGLGFISIFIVGFSTGMEPSLPVALATLAIVYGTGLGVFWRQKQKINSGLDDLLINESARTLELPLTFGRKARITASVADIESLYVDKIIHRSSKGGISYSYAPTLQLRGAESASQKIADWSDPLKADEFAGWLRHQLGSGITASQAAPRLPTTSEAMVEGSGDDPLGPAPTVEIPRSENFQVRVSDGPDGRDFYFPAARNRGSAIMLTVFFLIWSGVVWLLFAKPAPWMFRITFGFMDVALAWGWFNVWFHSSRVTINATRIRLTHRRLIFGRTREFDAGEITRFTANAGMVSGNKTYYDLKLVTRPDEESFAARKARLAQTGEMSPLQLRMNAPPGVTLASSIANPTEARWLVQEMTKALGRRA